MAVSSAAFTGLRNADQDRSRWDQALIRAALTANRSAQALLRERAAAAGAAGAVGRQ